MNRILRTLAPIAAALALSSAAQGQTLIGGGKTAPTFPIQITQPGSYKLAGNLVVTDPSKGAIVVTASDVSIDLNGYAVIGPNQCTSSISGPVTCMYADSNVAGISLPPVTGFEVVRVFNGTVRGFAGHGITGSGEFSRLLLTHNAGTGLFVGTSVLSQVTARHNMGAGIMASNSSITASLASYNGKSGFLLNRVTLANSFASYNRNFGVEGYAAGAVGMMGNNLASNAAGAMGLGVTSLTPSLCGGAVC